MRTVASPRPARAPRPLHLAFDDGFRTGVEHGGDEIRRLRAHDAPRTRRCRYARRGQTALRARSRYRVRLYRCLTEPTEWRPRKEAYPTRYLPNLRGRCSSHCRQDAQCRTILFDYLNLGAALWSRFNGGAEGPGGIIPSLREVNHAWPACPAALTSGSGVRGLALIDD